MKSSQPSIFSLLIYLCIAASVSCSDEQPTQDDLIYFEEIDYLNADSAIQITEHKQYMQKNFEDFKTNFETITRSQKLFYIVEGDLLYNEAALYQYYHSFDVDTLMHNKLVIGIGSGLDGKEYRDTMPNPDKLTYAIMENSFPLTSQYRIVKRNFTHAAAEWSNHLNNAVKLTHMEKLDTIKNEAHMKSKVSFIIKYTESSSDFVAVAFFPSTDRDAWEINVQSKYFVTSYDPIGVFRHEIGHVLGFRHEHSRDRAPAACTRENTPVDTLTSYDRVSLMHYFCGGVGNKKLSFTEKDIFGARYIYN